MSCMSQGGPKFFSHTQFTASSTWTITHNLGEQPSVDVNAFNGSTLLKAFPLAIIHINENVSSVIWNTPRTGYATLIATSGINI